MISKTAKPSDLEHAEIASSSWGSALLGSVSRIDDDAAKRFIQFVTTEHLPRFASGTHDALYVANWARERDGLSESSAKAVFDWAIKWQMSEQSRYTICFLLGQGRTGSDIARILSADPSWVELAVPYLRPDISLPPKPPGQALRALTPLLLALVPFLVMGAVIGAVAGGLVTVLRWLVGRADAGRLLFTSATVLPVSWRSSQSLATAADSGARRTPPLFASHSPRSGRAQATPRWSGTDFGDFPATLLTSAMDCSRHRPAREPSPPFAANWRTAGNQSALSTDRVHSLGNSVGPLPEKKDRKDLFWRNVWRAPRNQSWRADRDRTHRLINRWPTTPERSALLLKASQR
jgi:hypothetical protein